MTRTGRSGRPEVLGRHLACPPCNVGILSTPHYETRLGRPAVHALRYGVRVFAGQRAEQFYVDLGSIFDLGNLRPFQEANVFDKAAGLMAAPGVNATNHLNVHTIAIQVPISQLTRHGHPTIGVWTTASRQRCAWYPVARGRHRAPPAARSPHKVSRLGNPLVNEVLIPQGHKDFWNTSRPSTTSSSPLS